MPKSSNKKKKQKDADFKKTKLKVGKKKAVADNFTDTSFKAKAISLPSQSITHDKTTLLTNSRNATFAELITQLKHYSPGNRKDAILGLRDLFDHHPHLLSLHLGVLVNAIVRLLIDDSSIVRKTLQNFLSEFIPMLHPRDVHPFLPLLVVYTCSAMTHILEDIREDALKFMDLWVAAGGQIVVDGFWDKIIPNYVSLLTSDSNATNVSKLSSTMSFNTSLTNATLGGLGSSLSASRLVSRASTGKNAPGSLKAKCDVLQSLVGFLQEGLGGEGCEKDPYWFLRNFLGTPYARKSFNAIRTQWDRHDSLRDSRGIKRRKLQEQNVSERSSARSMYKGTVGSASDNIGDGSEASSQEGEMGTDNESIDSDQSTHSERNVQDEYLMFNSSPFISFSRAQTHHGILSTFPIHPITSCSPMTRTIFGGIKDPISDFREAANIQIRIFPQQGGRGSAATVTEANISTNGGGEGGENILGGIQGRLAQVRPLISTLHPLLLSLWLDNAPAVFASSTSIHANHTLAITHLVLKIWGILWRAALARPKKMNADSELEASMEREEQIWLEEYLQSLLRHVSIYFPFGKDTLAMMNPKVTATLQEMNTIYCELTSLFLLAPGVGRTRQQQRSSVQKPSYKSEIKKRQVVKTSCQPSNKEVKKRQAVTVADEPFFSSSSDYDSDEDVLVSEGRNGDDTVVVQTEAPKWADQVVQFVLDALGWVHPEAEDKDCLINTNTGKPSRMSSLSTDFKAQDLVSLLPTLWTLLNCLEPRRREWVFEGLMNFFDNAHVQSGSKKILLQFLALVIKIQSHPHYTGSFSVLIPGACAGTVQRDLAGVSKKYRREQKESVERMSRLLTASLLKLPKLLWDLGIERIETTQIILDLLAWVVMIAGDCHTETTHEKERVEFLKTFQSYMTLFFCVTVAGKDNKDEKRTVMGPFVNLPPKLQRRAIEIVYYLDVAPTISFSEVESVSRRKKDTSIQKLAPLLAAVKSCCQVDLPQETRLYIQETLHINACNVK